MTGYLRRLATTGAAYTASSVISKLIAVALLPLYTAYLSPEDYGAAEVLIVAVIAASIVIRLGIIEALLRFYYERDEDPDRVVKTGFASLFWTTTLGLAIALPLAEPISQLLLDRSDPELVRIAIFGLWVFTMYEFLLALFRLDERAKAFLAFTVSNVLVTIPVTVWLVVVQEEGAQGLLLGQYATGAVFLAALLVTQRRRLALVPDWPLLRRMTRFGLPTMPAELSLYSLNFIDRVMLVRLAGLADAGLYALSVKFAQAVNVLVKGFQLAWPPLAYSIEDDDEARQRLRGDRHLVRRRLHLLRRRPVAALALDRAPAGGAGVLRVIRGDRAGLDRGDAVRALPRARRRPRPHRAHRVQLPRDRRGHRGQHRPQPGPDPRAGDRRRRRLAGRLLLRGAGADVRLHAAPLPRPLRVAAAGPGGRPGGGAGGGRRAAAADGRLRGLRLARRRLDALSARALGDGLPLGRGAPRGGQQPDADARSASPCAASGRARPRPTGTSPRSPASPGRASPARPWRRPSATRTRASRKTSDWRGSVRRRGKGG